MGPPRLLVSPSFDLSAPKPSRPSPSTGFLFVRPPCMTGCVHPGRRRAVRLNILGYGSIRLGGLGFGWESPMLENLSWRTVVLFVAVLVVVSCPLAYGVIIAVDRTYVDGLVDAP